MQIGDAIGLAATSNKIEKLAGWIFVLSLIAVVGCIVGFVVVQSQYDKLAVIFVYPFSGALFAAFWSGVVWVGAIVMRWLLSDQTS